VGGVGWYTVPIMPAKVCPRCGAQYQNLKSTTCPQCFAVLVAVDDETAQELTEARAAVERTPEFKAVKADDDERFQEQSFGACLGVLVITIITLVLAGTLIAVAAHRHHAATRPLTIARSHTIAPLVGAPEPLTTLPVAAAGLDDVLPPTLGPYQRSERDADVVLTGTLTPLFHGVYARPGQAALDVYALPSGRPTSEQNEFRLGLSLAARVGGADRPLLFFATEYWRFAALAAPHAEAAPDDLRDALAAHFRQP